MRIDRLDVAVAVMGRKVRLLGISGGTVRVKLKKIKKNRKF